VRNTAIANIDVSGVAFQALTGWERLNSGEKNEVQNETAQLLGAVTMTGKGRLAMGKHLANLRDILEPKKLFDKYLKLEGLSLLQISRATAYRHIGNYQQAITILSPPVMELALMRGMDKLDRHMIQAAPPPPRGDDPARAAKYLDAVIALGREAVNDTGNDSVTLQKEAYNLVLNRFKRLPTEGRERAQWVRDLCGMLLAMTGTSGDVQIGPVAVPDHFKAAPVGRPRKKA
jgi:hypothetical protein